MKNKPYIRIEIPKKARDARELLEDLEKFQETGKGREMIENFFSYGFIVLEYENAIRVDFPERYITEEDEEIMKLEESEADQEFRNICVDLDFCIEHTLEKIQQAVKQLEEEEELQNDSRREFEALEEEFFEEATYFMNDREKEIARHNFENKGTAWKLGKDGLGLMVHARKRHEESQYDQISKRGLSEDQIQDMRDAFSA